MYKVEDKPETIHLYVVREEAARPSVTPIILSLLVLSLLIVLGITIPYTQPVTRLAIRVPAVPFAIKSFSASVPITPTGVKTYPATIAHGNLSIRNGSVIGQSIPADFVISGVATDAAIYVPGATVNGDSYVSVAAHVVTAGVNLPSFAIDTVIGASLFIRNPEPFNGARPAYSVKYVTEQDKQTALMQARSQITSEVVGLHYPCRESLRSAAAFEVTWRCQFITYHVPSYMHVSTVQLIGTQVIVNVWFVEHPKRIWVK